MAKLTKKQKEAHAKIDKNQAYSLKDASALVKEITSVSVSVSGFSFSFFTMRPVRVLVFPEPAAAITWIYFSVLCMIDNCS